MRIPRYFLEAQRVQEIADQQTDEINDMEEAFQQVEYRRRWLEELQEMIAEDVN